MWAAVWACEKMSMSNAIPSTLIILLHICKNKFQFLYLLILFILATCGQALPPVSCHFRLMEGPYDKSHSSCEFCHHSEGSLRGRMWWRLLVSPLEVSERERDREKDWERERERDREREREREGVSEREWVREPERERERKREINKTPTHLHSVSAIQHLAEMASSSFWCKTGLKANIILTRSKWAHIISKLTLTLHPSSFEEMIWLKMCVSVSQRCSLLH